MNGRAMIAAARVGSGRLVHVGHEGLMNVTPNDEGDGFQFVQNVMTWLKQTRKPTWRSNPGSSI